MTATRVRPLAPADATFLAAARLRAARQQAYLASALFALVPVDTPGHGTFSVDGYWRLYVDMEQARAWGVEASAAVLLHEVHHLVRCHHDRAARAKVAPHERELWNYVADAAINDDLVADGLPLPDPVLPHHLGLPARGVEEHYFEALRNRWGVDPCRCGSGSGGARLGVELDDEADVDKVDDLDAQAVRRDVAHQVAQAVDRGERVSPGLVLWARAYLDPQVPWQRVLRSALSRPLRAVVGASEPTWTRPDRRAASVPHVLRPGSRRVRPQVAVVIDTSGSMSRSLLNVAVTEIDAIVRRSGAATTVVVCDEVAASPQHVRTIAELQLTGGGGTDMRVGIDAALQLRPCPQIVVVLTDGLTPWPVAAPVGTTLVAVVIGNDAPLPKGERIVALRVEGER
jgi:predicted metal-dependent peptidase